ncbi:MAG: transglycosylase domain-containing protein [Holosporales bacterium]|jgi:penicillin-binding protein 1A|nr:transglycosylase domain-containing protein [Holosporales bacterium]
MGKSRNTKKRRKRKSFLSIFLKYILYSATCCFVAIACILFYFASGLPDLQNLKTEIRSPSVTVQTYDGKIIGSYGDLYEEVVHVSELPKHVIAAFMAVEDKRFFQHFGIDFVGLFRAVYRNYITGKVVQGGSTITQQLAKNILIGEGLVTHYDRTIGRKIKELLLAIWLEYKFTKSEVLMMYLNRVYFGAGAYGIDAASRKYFNKSAKQLGVFESAVLAGLLKAPSRYSPTSHPNYAHERAMVVLNTMEEQGLIKSAKEVEAREATSAFSHDTKRNLGSMYFCDYVYESAQKILGEITDDIVVVTTFDEKKQAAAEEAVEFYIRTEGQNYNFSQTAFICMKRDGAIQAMIGGASYTTTQFNRATQAERFPGSAFKIFVYGAALEYGYQLDDMIQDTPVSIAGWKPGNYRWRSRGALSILNGFTYSVNSVCVRLAQAVGLTRVAKFAKKLGIYDVSTQDLSVALGTTPVTLKDLTAAYASFMDGMAVWTYCITEIRTKSGKILYQKKQEAGTIVLDDELLRNCRELLRSVVHRGSGRRANVNKYIYGKTGTNGSTDACFIGFYDPDEEDDGCACGIWIGHDVNKQKMRADSTGGRVPAMIFARFMRTVLHPEQRPATTDQPKGLGQLLGL